MNRLPEFVASLLVAAFIFCGYTYWKGRKIEIIEDEENIWQLRKPPS
jgi:hypothetical protein